MSISPADYSHHSKTRKRSAVWIALSVLGFISFVLFQIILPSVKSDEAAEKSISEQQAIQRAENFLLQPEIAAFIQPPTKLSTTKRIEAYYHTNDELSGYISHSGTENTYRSWEKKAPYDVYRVLVLEQENQDPLLSSFPYERLTKIDIHMKTGQVVGFQTESNGNPPARDNRTEPNDPWKQSDQVLRLFGWSTEHVKRVPLASEDGGSVYYEVPRAAVGEARLELHLEWNDHSLLQMLPSWEIPSSYSTLIAQQQASAERIHNVVYVGMSLLLSIASIIITILYRKPIAFRSRTLILLTVMSCSISLVHVWNMTEGYFMVSEHQLLPEKNLQTAIIIQAVITLIQAGLALYFSLVAGRWMWRQTKYNNIMPSWSDENFGEHLVQAFWRGIGWTGILLGAQTLIFSIMEKGLDTWVSTEALNSPINLHAPILFPLLAWVAAISEEGFFRLFAIGLFHRFIRNVWIASLIPTFVWAAGHVMYPIYPFYSRPVELMIIGMLFVWMMLKHGFWTAVVAHLMFDTVLMAIGFLFGTDWTDVLIGAAYILLPLVVVYGLRYLHSNRKQTAQIAYPQPPPSS
ncbi:CPBP family intramembrane glutamic endopeptidase [Paenibacillus arenosi]|uniref:CPBP family intramembrane metalloprotease n=1 Tax=Paenibacillus arenosi TaxID=2774142 RepID=A0ABR9AY70_9BACL|nr:CPBP family intramembrane glutamic endopeptidase [Paenibacillus arenosi]MBD8499090.1 CPBP family intramembrane metalloprotease [Paenibacillus arenosi]